MEEWKKRKWRKECLITLDTNSRHGGSYQANVILNGIVESIILTWYVYWVASSASLSST